MAIYEVLKWKEEAPSTARHNDFYVGSLSDYMQSSSNSYPDCNDIFQKMLDKDEELCVCAQLPIEISQKTISNQIIHYKDAFKIGENSVKAPLIIFWKNDDKDRAILFSDTSYVEAKGLYYCLTEPDGEFGNCRNEIIAMVLGEEFKSDILKAFDEMHGNERAVGAIQRYYDHKYLENVDEMKDKAIALAQSILDDAQQTLPSLEDKGPLINKTIGRIFLIKKAIYVQYMMSKDILASRHEGDVKKQRQFAKAYATEIPIVSLSALWRGTAPAEPAAAAPAAEAEEETPAETVEEAVEAVAEEAAPAVEEAVEAVKETVEAAEEAVEEAAEAVEEAAEEVAEAVKEEA